MTIRNNNLLLAAILVIVGFTFGVILAANRYDAGPLAKLQGMRSNASLKDIPKVHFVYLNPTDLPKNDLYIKGLENAASNLQDWYGKQLDLESIGGTSFSYSVDYYTLPNDSSHYNTGGQWDYYTRTLEDGFRLTGGKFDDPNNRWVFLNAAMIGKEQGAGGTNGIAVLHGDDLKGLAGETNPPNIGRYIGGLGHELGHAFTLPHPSDCPGAPRCENVLMYLGYLVYPNNVTLTVEDKNTLLNSNQVRQFFLPEFQSTIDYSGNAFLATFDLNYDGKLTDEDVRIEQGCQIGIGSCSLARNDFNKDGQIISNDVVMIQRAVLGLDPYRITSNPYDLDGDSEITQYDYDLELGCTIGYGVCSLARNDFNKDGKIDSVDAVMMERVLKGLDPNPVSSNPYDLDGDGQVTNADIEIQQGCQIGIGSCSLGRNDFNKDGKIDSVDTVMITRVSRGLSPTETNPTTAPDYGGNVFLQTFDLNLDGKLTNEDVVKEQECQIGISTVCSLARNDFNKDGKIDSNDVVMIDRAVKGLYPFRLTSNLYDLDGDEKTTQFDVDLENGCVVGLGVCSVERNDFNKDGKIDSVDLVMIQRVQRGLNPTVTNSPSNTNTAPTTTNSNSNANGNTNSNNIENTNTANTVVQVDENKRVIKVTKKSRLNTIKNWLFSFSN